MPEGDRAYYQQRLARETERARQAAQPCVASAHRELAQAYRSKLAALDLLEGKSA